MKWLRTHFVTDEYENSNLTLDLLVGPDNRPVDRVPFCGWWGRIKSTDVLPVIVYPDGKVDFGSDEETDQTTRYGRIALMGKPIERGTSVFFECDGLEYALRVESCRDLTEGIN